MSKIDPVRSGDEITQGLLDRIVDQLERFHNLRSGSPYILVSDGPNGKLLDLDLPAPTWALLSGSTSPYSFTEVRDGPAGTWVSMANGDSGTSNVYEANGKSGLAGKVVPITWTSAGDWRFQWVGYGFNCGWRFVTTGCLGDPLEGCLVEIRQSGVLIDSCTTAAGGTVAKIKRDSGGTGYTNGSYSNGTLSGGGGSGGTFNYSVSGGAINATFTITNAGSGYTSPPTPVFNAGPGTGASATALLRSSCLLTPPAGTYDVTVSGPSGAGFAANTASRSFSCTTSADVLVPIALGADSATHVCVAICNYPIPKTLHTSDGLGSHTLVRTGSGWSETVQVPGYAGSCTALGTVDVNYFFGVIGNGWQLVISWKYTCCGDVPDLHSIYSNSLFLGSASSDIVLACPPAFSVSFTVPVRDQDSIDAGDICFNDDPTTGGPGLQTPGGGGTMVVTS